MSAINNEHIYVYVSNHCHASLCESEFPQLTVHRNNKMNIYMIHKYMCQSDIFLLEVILTLSGVDAETHWSYEHL